MVHLLTLNLILSLVWGFITGNFSGLNLFMGFLLGTLVIFLAERALGSKSYLRRLWSILTYLLFFLRELLKSSFRVAWEIITPNYGIRPGVVAIELDEDTNDLQATLLANTITLTPGTLTLDILQDPEDAQKRKLFIHAMYIDDVDALKREIKREFEARAKEVIDA